MHSPMRAILAADAEDALFAHHGRGIRRIIERANAARDLRVYREAIPVLEKEFKKQRKKFPLLQVRFGNGSSLLTWREDGKGLSDRYRGERFPRALNRLRVLCDALAFEFPCADLPKQKKTKTNPQPPETP